MNIYVILTFYGVSVTKTKKEVNEYVGTVELKAFLAFVLTARVLRPNLLPFQYLLASSIPFRRSAGSLPEWTM